MSRKIGGFSVIILLLMVLFMPSTSTIAQEIPPEEGLQLLETLVESDPAQALERILSLKDEVRGDPLLLQRIQLLHGRALMRLSRFLESEKVLQSLIETMASGSDSETLPVAATAHEAGRLLIRLNRLRMKARDVEIRALRRGKQRILTVSIIGLALLFALIAGLILYGRRTRRRTRLELKKLQLRLDDLSRMDSLTGLPNRRVMIENLELLQARANREKSPLALLMIDMDNFKSINDTLGHTKGDQVLRLVARTLRSCTRGQDLLAHWGGEAFLVALSGTDRNNAFKAAEKYRNVVEALDRPKKSPEITITIGLAIYTAGEDIQKTITRADDHVQAGKKAGRNRVVG